MEKEATNLKESREGVWEAFEGRKGREKYNLNNKNTHKSCKLFYNINNHIWYKKRRETLSFKFHNFGSRCAAVAGQGPGFHNFVSMQVGELISILWCLIALAFLAMEDDITL